MLSAIDTKDNFAYDAFSIDSGERVMYAKEMPLTLEQVSEFVAYDELTGAFTWKKGPNRRTKAGTDAGRFKKIKTTSGCLKRYKYIGFMYYQTPAARIAWLLMTGAWPKGNVLFKDDNSENLKWDNLQEGVFPPEKFIADGRRHYKMTPEALRHYGLKRYYGMTVEEHNLKLAEQGGVCAICRKPETGRGPYGGAVKPLSVDHNHATKQVRGLLCTQCNYMIGHARENRDTLLEGVKYLDKHSGAAATVTPLSVVPKTGD